MNKKKFNILSQHLKRSGNFHFDEWVLSDITGVIFTVKKHALALQPSKTSCSFVFSPLYDPV